MACPAITTASADRVHSPADGDQRERFDDEWRILRALCGPPYVVAVEQHGRHDDGRPFFTMELVEGPTLAELIADRDVTVAPAC